LAFFSEKIKERDFLQHRFYRHHDG